MNPTPTEATLKRLTKQIDQTFEEVARLSGMNLPPTDFYQQFLEKVLAGIESPAGAVWLRTPQGFLQLQCQINLDKIGLDFHKGARQHHNELLRFAFQNKKELIVEPGQSVKLGDNAVDNKTEHVIILAPIKVSDEQSVGLVEVCPEAGWDSNVLPMYLNYVIQMAGYASNYVMQTTSRTSNNQEQVWAQLEAFARSIHSSLNPTEVSYQIANDGRRLIGCDRLSVAIRHGNKAKVEAVSGSDVVEKASTHVRAMRRLFDEVIRWGERLVFRGTQDETLPPRVLTALDDYLAESSPKLLVVEPLRDEREKEDKKPRSALLMESFEPPAQVEPLVNRLEIVGKHSASALYNAAEMKRIPFRWALTPILAVQDGLGGKTRFWITAVSILSLGLIAAMILMPWPLRVDANGELVPKQRQYIYPPHQGRIERFAVNAGEVVGANTTMARMFDAELQQKIQELKEQIEATDYTQKVLGSQLSVQGLDLVERKRLEKDFGNLKVKLNVLRQQLERFESIYNADPSNPGFFDVNAPEFAAGSGRQAWTVLNANFEENLRGKTVDPTTPILRVGNKAGSWEIEMKIPQKHVGQVLKAFQTDEPDEYLEVDVLVTSVPTHTYRGWLFRRHIGGEAVPNRDDHNESEPVVYAYVTVNHPDMEPSRQIPEELLVTGVETHMKIRCGDRAMGYSLFYGLWEFMYRNVIFYF